MKIVAFSDVHGRISKKLNDWFIEHPADLLIFSGDIQKNHFDYGEEFLYWIDSLPYNHKVITFGNHDGNWNITTEIARRYDNIHILNHQFINIDGVNIFGSPYSIPFGDWWFMETEENLEKLYSKIPDDTNILVTHSPAYGILDNNTEGKHCGSMSLLKRIKQLKSLKYHIFGHIHESKGIKRFTHRTHYNASVLDEEYRQVYMPYIFEY